MKQNYYRQQRCSAGIQINKAIPPLQIKRNLSSNKIIQPGIPTIGSHLRTIMKQQFVPTNSINNEQNQILRNQETILQEIPKQLQDINMYTILNVLGHGANAEVKLAKHKMLDIVVAIKCYGLKIDTKQLEHEVQILKDLNHPNIIKLYYKLQTQTSIYLFQEYFSPITIDTFLKGRTIKRLTEEQVKIIAKQLFGAVQYLHTLNIIHRDLKLENILIESQSLKIKLIDFGYAIKSIELQKTSCGTLSYMAPELIKQIQYDNKVDIWACGIILYRLLTGIFPFRANSEQELNKKILIGKIDYPTYLSNNAKIMLQCLLNVNAQNRQILSFDFLQ